MRLLKLVLVLCGIASGSTTSIFAQSSWKNLNQKLNETHQYDSEEVRLTKLAEFNDSLMLKIKFENEFSFDSIQQLVYFNTKDFRFFNWAFRFDNGEMKYYGVLEIKKSKRIIELDDISASTPFPEDSIFMVPRWWGALYSQIIETQIDNKTYYNFLGWNAVNDFYHQKVIDVLSFKSNGDAIFGSKIYKLDKKAQARVVFRYSRKADMLLKYDFQAYTEKIKPKDKKKQISLKQIPANLIIFERLFCPQNHLEGDFAYYLPSGNIYDALFFDGKRWILKLDVWARNPNPKTTIKPRRDEPKLYDPSR